MRCILVLAMLSSIAMPAVAGQALALTDGEERRLDAFRAEKTARRLAAQKAAKEADFRTAQRIWEEIAADCEAVLADVKPCSEFYGALMTAASRTGDTVMERYAESKWRVGVFVASAPVPATATEAERRVGLRDKTLDVVAAETVLRQAIARSAGTDPAVHGEQSDFHLALVRIYLARRDMAKVATHAIQAAEMAERADTLMAAIKPGEVRQSDDSRWFWSRRISAQLADEFEKAGQHAAAETVFRALLAYEPERRRWLVLGRLARVIHLQGRAAEAASLSLQALDQQRRYHVATHPGLIATYGYVARDYAGLPDGAATSRTLLRLQDQALRARIAAYPSFDAAAQREMARAGRDYRLAVEINWRLSRR
ncbi:hypothetical protein [Sphingomonas sp.]|uniref:hypothetical protein n=1 Tax=Sphingomonas sp. TaxID=28214 RepID=UPI003F70EFEF